MVFLRQNIRNGKKILSAAEEYLGQKEVPQNLGFANPEFAGRMREVGFKAGYEWCMLFVKAAVLDALSGDKKQIADKLINASTQQTFANIKNNGAGVFKIVKHPKPGDIVIWQRRDLSFKGHAGIIKKVYRKGFISVEGNVNNQVAEVSRSKYGNDKFIIKGFIRIL